MIGICQHAQMVMVPCQHPQLQRQEGQSEVEAVREQGATRV